MSSVQSQSDKVRALKAAHAPQVEVTAAIEELKRLMASEQDGKSVPVAQETKSKSSSTLTLDAAAEKIKALKKKHASQAEVSQAVAEYTVLKETNSVNEVEVAAARIRVLKSAHANSELVSAAIQEYKAISEKSSATSTVSSTTPPTAVSLPTQVETSTKQKQPSTPSIDSLTQKVKALKAAGAPQEQVAAAVAELTALKNKGSLDPKVVSEEKVRALKEAHAPQATVQRAVDEHKNLKQSQEKNSKVTDKPESKKANTTNSETKQTSSSSSSSSSSGVNVYDSENFDDFQARVAKRANPINHAFVSARGLSPAITSITSSSAKGTTTSSDFQRQSEISEQRINELSALCDKFKRPSVDMTELQQLRAENTKATAQNNALRKALQEKGTTTQKAQQDNKPQKQEKKAEQPQTQGKSKEQSQPSSRPTTEVKKSEGFAAWQTATSSRWETLKKTPDVVGWPGDHWLEQAKKVCLVSATQPSELVNLAQDATSGTGRAIGYILKQFPLPK